MCVQYEYIESVDTQLRQGRIFSDKTYRQVLNEHFISKPLSNTEQTHNINTVRHIVNKVLLKGINKESKIACRCCQTK